MAAPAALAERAKDERTRANEGGRFHMNGVTRLHNDAIVEVSPPEPQRPAPQLRAGEVGYMHGAIKQVAHARVGDTISSVSEASDVAECNSASAFEPKLGPCVGGPPRLLSSHSSTDLSRFVCAIDASERRAARVPSAPSCAVLGAFSSSDSRSICAETPASI